MIFDTHAHYDDTAFDEDREEIIESLSSFHIQKVVNVGASLQSTRNGKALSERYPFFYFAAGIHPDEVLKDAAQKSEKEIIEELREAALSEKCAAIGEIGLDYHGFDLYEDKPSKETQQYWFVRQLELASELRKPVIIHSRNASADTLETMRFAHDTLGIENAVIHCYSYSREAALEYVRMGYYLGFGGSVTYEGQKKISKVLTAVPMDRIVLETDCPYLAPVPMRGTRNFSGNLGIIIEKIAEIRNMDPKELEAAAWENAHRLYRIPQEEERGALEEI